MANLTKTITNSVNTFGGITDLWGSWNWNAFKWGEGTADLPVAVIHLITNTLTPTETIAGFQVEHLISESLAPGSEMTDEKLLDGSGYYYVFPSNTIEHEDAVVSTYSSGSAPSSSWSAGTGNTTSWS